jgi:ABC-type glycerol-3-phosphate transport system substrate-binding protein
LCRPDTQLNRIRKIGGSPTIPELYNDPDMLVSNPYFSTILKTYRNDKVWRPSMETGKRYPDLSRAYYTTVHEILEGKQPAASALSDLQAELMQITGLNAPAPGTSSEPHGKRSAAAMPHRPDGALNEVNTTPGGI